MTDSRDARVADAFALDPYAAAQGFVLGDITRDTVSVSLTVRDDHLNFHGTLHGGALFSLADCAFSLASNSEGRAAVAIDTHLVLTSPTRLGDTITAIAFEVSLGRQLATYRVDVNRSDGRTVGLFTGTVFLA